jgi:hypothetical protein
MWIPVLCKADFRESRADVRDDALRNADPRVRPFDHYRRRAGGDCGFNVTVAVMRFPGDSHKDFSRTKVTAVAAKRRRNNIPGTDKTDRA